MGRLSARKPVNHTSGVTAVSPTDRPKSVRNRCVIEVFGGVLYVVTLLFGFFCECRGVCNRTESDLFLFSTLYTTIPHPKLKSRLATITRNSFIHKKWKSQIQNFGFRSRRTLLCQGTIRFEKQVD